MTKTSRHVTAGLMVAVGLTASGWAASADDAQSSTVILQERRTASEVLDWNQIFIDTLIATNTANSSSQRLGAIVHTAIFDAYNGIERRYTPIFVDSNAPDGASRRAAVIAAARNALVGLFPTQQAALDAHYAASLAALGDDCERSSHRHGRRRSCATRIERGIAWGTEVAQAVLAWRATDGFSAPYPPFTGGSAVGQWRPTPPAFGPMSAQGLAFTVDQLRRPRRIRTPQYRTTTAIAARISFVIVIRAFSSQAGYGVFDSDVVQAFRPARHGGPKGPHYTNVENALAAPDPKDALLLASQADRRAAVTAHLP